LFSTVPQLYYLNDTIFDQLASFIHELPIINSIISLEFDENCGISIVSDESRLCFCHLRNLTHISITLMRFHYFIDLLNQLGSQLHSFTVGFINVFRREEQDVLQIASVGKLLFTF
jgi:hypothetical protein